MYLEIDEGFPGHRKTLRLCAALKNPEAAWYVIRLWTWACRSCPTGDLSGMDPYDIEIAVQYRPLDGACYAAMVAAGFIDEVGGRPGEIHDWMERTGGAIARMADAAARKKDYRAHKDGKCDPEWCRFCEGASVDSPQDKPKTVRRTSTGQTDTDKTRQVQTSPDPETENSPPPAIPEQRAPYRAPRAPYPVAAATIPFCETFDRYVNPASKIPAASVWQELSAEHAGGERGLAAEIGAAFTSGLLQQPPYSLDMRYRPTFETFLAKRLWLDPVAPAESVRARGSPVPRRDPLADLEDLTPAPPRKANTA